MTNHKVTMNDSKSLAEMVRERLKSDIYSMVLSPGQPLVENDIAKAFNISRTPVREALKALEAEGLAVSYPGRGSQVSEVSFTDLLEAFEVRELIEPYAARKAAASHDEKVRAQIQTMLDYLIANPAGSSDLTERIEFDLQLHDLILRASGNETLRSIVRGLHFRTRRTYPILKGYLETGEEHCLITKAILAHDEDQAEMRMRQHIHGLRIRLIS
jgi:DNA-binding GntR family transcriptional regulator